MQASVEAWDIEREREAKQEAEQAAAEKALEAKGW